MAGDNVNTEPAGQEAPWSFWDVFKGLAMYVAFPGFLLYPAGFLVFVLQIQSFYPLDVSTAWYATSLIPATVVTGQGAKVLAPSPISRAAATQSA